MFAKQLVKNIKDDIKKRADEKTVQAQPLPPQEFVDWYEDVMDKYKKQMNIHTPEDLNIEVYKPDAKVFFDKAIDFWKKECPQVLQLKEDIELTMDDMPDPLEITKFKVGQYQISCLKEQQARLEDEAL